eukprot:Sspe_Gene.24780::Locus_9860_Transcript_2_2_Confidence_0.667_Length_8049::g.24780::m.24780
MLGTEDEEPWSVPRETTVMSSQGMEIVVLSSILETDREDSDYIPDIDLHDDIPSYSFGDPLDTKAVVGENFIALESRVVPSIRLQVSVSRDDNLLGMATVQSKDHSIHVTIRGLLANTEHLCTLQISEEVYSVIFTTYPRLLIHRLCGLGETMAKMNWVADPAPPKALEGHPGIPRWEPRHALHHYFVEVIACQVRVVDDQWFQDDPVVRTFTTQTPITLAGLAPGSEYMVRVRRVLRSEEGTSFGVWSNWGTFSTLGTLELKPLLQTGDSIALGWDRLHEQRAAGPPQAWRLDTGDLSSFELLGVDKFCVTVTAKWEDNEARRAMLTEQLEGVVRSLEEDAVSSESEDYDDADDLADHRERKREWAARLEKRKEIEECIARDDFCFYRMQVVVEAAKKYVVLDGLESGVQYTATIHRSGSEAEGLIAQPFAFTLKENKASRIDLGKVDLSSEHSLAFSNVATYLMEEDRRFEDGEKASAKGETDPVLGINLCMHLQLLAVHEQQARIAWAPFDIELENTLLNSITLLRGHRNQSRDWENTISGESDDGAFGNNEYQPLLIPPRWQVMMEAVVAALSIVASAPGYPTQIEERTVADNRSVYEALNKLRREKDNFREVKDRHEMYQVDIEIWVRLLKVPDNGVPQEWLDIDTVSDSAMGKRRRAGGRRKEKEEEQEDEEWAKRDPLFEEGYSYKVKVPKQWWTKHEGSDVGSLLFHPLVPGTRYVVRLASRLVKLDNLPSLDNSRTQVLRVRLPWQPFSPPLYFTTRSPASVAVTHLDFSPATPDLFYVLPVPTPYHRDMGSPSLYQLFHFRIVISAPDGEGGFRPRREVDKYFLLREASELSGEGLGLPDFPYYISIFGAPVGGFPIRGVVSGRGKAVITVRQYFIPLGCKDFLVESLHDSEWGSFGPPVILASRYAEIFVRDVQDTQLTVGWEPDDIAWRGAAAGVAQLTLESATWEGVRKLVTLGKEDLQRKGEHVFTGLMYDRYRVTMLVVTTFGDLDDEAEAWVQSSWEPVSIPVALIHVFDPFLFRVGEDYVTLHCVHRAGAEGTTAHISDVSEFHDSSVLHSACQNVERLRMEEQEMKATGMVYAQDLSLFEVRFEVVDDDVHQEPLISTFHPSALLTGTIEGLTPGCTYLLTIRPQLPKGRGVTRWGEWGASVRFRTLRVVELEVSLVGEDYAGFHWRRHYPYPELAPFGTDEDYLPRVTATRATRASRVSAHRVEGERQLTDFTLSDNSSRDFNFEESVHSKRELTAVFEESSADGPLQYLDRIYDLVGPYQLVVQQLHASVSIGHTSLFRLQQLAAGGAMTSDERMRLDPELVDGVSLSKILRASEQGHILRELPKGAQYKVKVRQAREAALDNEGNQIWSSFSCCLVFWTPPPLPVMVDNILETTARLTYTPPEKVIEALDAIFPAPADTDSPQTESCMCDASEMTALQVRLIEGYDPTRQLQLVEPLVPPLWWASTGQSLEAVEKQWQVHCRYTHIRNAASPDEFDTFPPLYRNECNCANVPVEGSRSRVINILASPEGTFLLNGLHSYTIYGLQSRMRFGDEHPGGWTDLSTFQTMSRITVKVERVASNYASISWHRKRTIYEGDEPSPWQGYTPLCRMTCWELTIKGMLPNRSPDAGLSMSDKGTTVEGVPGVVWFHETAKHRVHPSASSHSFVNLLPHSKYMVTVASLHEDGVVSHSSEKVTFNTRPSLKVDICKVGPTFAVVQCAVLSGGSDAVHEIRVFDTADEAWEEYHDTLEVGVLVAHSKFHPPIHEVGSGEYVVRGLKSLHRYAVMAREVPRESSEVSSAVDVLYRKWSALTVFSTSPLPSGETFFTGETEGGVRVQQTLPYKGQDDTSCAVSYQLALNGAVAPLLITLSPSSPGVHVAPDDSHTGSVAVSVAIGIKGLTLNTLYTVKLRCQITDGLWADWQDVVTFATTPQRPCTPFLYESRNGWAAFYWKLEDNEDIIPIPAEPHPHDLSPRVYGADTPVPSAVFGAKELQDIDTRRSESDLSHGEEVPLYKLLRMRFVQYLLDPEDTAPRLERKGSYTVTLHFTDFEPLPTSLPSAAVPRQASHHFGYIVEVAHRLDPLLDQDGGMYHGDFSEVGRVKSGFARVQLQQPLSSYLFRLRTCSMDNSLEDFVSRPSPIVGFIDPPHPVAPHGVMVDDVQHTSALVKWDPPNDASMHFQLWYAVYSRRVGTDERWKEEGRVRIPGLFLSDLCIGTTYRIGVRCFSNFGSSTMSTTVTFTTQRHCVSPFPTATFMRHRYELNDPRAVWQPKDYDWPYPNPVAFDAIPVEPTSFHLYQTLTMSYSVPLRNPDLLAKQWEQTLVLPRGIPYTSKARTKIRHEKESNAAGIVAPPPTRRFHVHRPSTALTHPSKPPSPRPPALPPARPRPHSARLPRRKSPPPKRTLLLSSPLPWNIEEEYPDYVPPNLARRRLSSRVDALPPKPWNFRDLHRRSSPEAPRSPLEDLL